MRRNEKRLQARIVVFGFLIIRSISVYFLIPGREKVERYHNTSDLLDTILGNPFEGQASNLGPNMTESD